MIISEWVLNEKIMLERFKNHCVGNGLIVTGNKNFQLLFMEWKEHYFQWLKELEEEKKSDIVRI